MFDDLAIFGNGMFHGSSENQRIMSPHPFREEISSLWDKLG